MIIISDLNQPCHFPTLASGLVVRGSGAIITALQFLRLAKGCWQAGVGKLVVDVDV